MKGTRYYEDQYDEKDGCICSFRSDDSSACRTGIRSDDQDADERYCSGTDHYSRRNCGLYDPEGYSAVQPFILLKKCFHFIGISGKYNYYILPVVLHQLNYSIDCLITISMAVIHQ